MSLAIFPSDAPAGEQPLVATLRRPNGLGNGWGLIRTLLLGTLSFGALPLLAWSIRMRDLFAGEAARLVEVCRVAAPDPTRAHRLSLMRSARRTAPLGLLWILPVLAASFVISGAAVILTTNGPDNFDQIVRLTNGASRSAPLDDPLALLQSVFGVWSAVLIVGYVIHFLHVQTHFSAVRRFLIRFNEVLAMSGVQTIPLPRRSVLPGLMWVAAGLVMTTCGAYWALPMVLAGSIQRRGAYQMHRELSKVLADRVDALVHAKATPELRCQTLRCQTLLRPAARFCPRCGSAVNPLLVSGVWA